MATLYETMEVSETCSKETLQAAYKSLAKRFHPDICSTAQAKTRMSEITEAYAILSDAGKRVAYDAQLKDHRATSSGTYQQHPHDWDAQRRRLNGFDCGVPVEDVALSLIEAFALPNLPGIFSTAYPAARNDIRSLISAGVERLVQQ